MFSYLYYKFYKAIYNLKQWTKKINTLLYLTTNEPVWAAWSFLSATQMALMLCIFTIINLFYRVKDDILLKPILIFICGFPGVFNYFRYLYKKRYLKVVEKYKNESDGKKIAGWIFLVVYIIATVGGMFLMFYIFSLYSKK